MDELILILDGGEELCLVLDGEEELELVLTDPVGIFVPEYEGEYEVTPRLFEQTLETNGKRMSDDVQVHVIPVVYTTNPYDGKTVVIG